MLHHITLARKFVEGMNFTDFENDLRTTYAVIRCLEIISEASRRLPETVKVRHPAIAWKEMAGAGNVYRRDYEDVTPFAVWVVLQDHLPSLCAVVEQELAAAGRLRPGLE